MIWTGRRDPVDGVPALNETWTVQDDEFLFDDDLCPRRPGHEPHRFGAYVNGSIRHPLHCSGKPLQAED